MVYGNGAATSYAYRPDNRRLLNVTASLPNGGYTFHNFSFTYDKVGNVLSLQNAALAPARNSIGGPWTKTYGYDDLWAVTSSAWSRPSTVWLRRAFGSLPPAWWHRLTTPPA